MAKDAKYLQVTQWIMEQIKSDQLRAGDKLESEHQLGDRFGLSRQTVRHALAVLEQKGAVEKVQGSGTYVRHTAETLRPGGKLSDTVTIISTYINGYIFPEILQAMVGCLEQAGFRSRLLFTENRFDQERRLLNRLLEEGSRDPVIMEPVMSGLPNPNLSCYRQLRAAGVPILFFHSFYPELTIPHVGMDDVGAGRAAAEYLIARGHTRIAGVFKADDGQGRRRFEGYLQALLQARIAVSEEHVCWIDTQDMTGGRESGERIWRRLAGCTACVCYNDEVAYRLVQQASARGIRVPEDLSLVSFDDSELARLCAVPLTSVIHPKGQLGKKVAENMLRLAENPGFHATWEFPPKIRQRDSVFAGEH